MKIGKQINKGEKCPNCKAYMVFLYHEPMYIHNTYANVMPVFKCSHCNAMYECVEDDKNENKGKCVKKVH